MNSPSPIDILNAFRQMTGDAFPQAMALAIIVSVGIAYYIMRGASEKTETDLEKPKNKFDRFSVPYDQDADDDKPKRREPYMTIGDDGELVEMEE